jgi:hypothetical protein
MMSALGSSDVPVNEILGLLVGVLQREQAAIRTLDVPALTEATRQKEALAEQFAGARPAIQALASSTDPALRDARIQATYVRALAHANRMLLDEVSATIGARLGVSSETTGYDARGGRRGSLRFRAHRGGVL